MLKLHEQRGQLMEPTYVKEVVTKGGQGTKDRHTRAQHEKASEVAENNKSYFQHALEVAKYRLL